MLCTNGVQLTDVIWWCCVYIGLGSVQNTLQNVNHMILRFYGLHSWRSAEATQKYLTILCAVFLCLVFIPFRWMFALGTIYFFTYKWQSEGSAITDLLNRVPIPTDAELTSKLE